MNPTAIASGDLLLVIETVDGTLTTTNSASYGLTSYGAAGKYEFVKAASALVAGATESVTIVGTNAGGLINRYTNNGNSQFEVIIRTGCGRRASRRSRGDCDADDDDRSDSYFPGGGEAPRPPSVRPVRCGGGRDGPPPRVLPRSAGASRPVFEGHQGGKEGVGGPYRGRRLQCPASSRNRLGVGERQCNDVGIVSRRISVGRRVRDVDHP